MNKHYKDSLQEKEKAVNDLQYNQIDYLYLTRGFML